MTSLEVIFRVWTVFGTTSQTVVTWSQIRRMSLPQGTNNTSQQDFGTRKIYCVSNVTFHAESKYAIKIFSSPTVFVQWPF